VGIAHATLEAYPTLHPAGEIASSRILCLQHVESGAEMAKVAQFEKGKTVVFGPEGFGEKVVLGNKVTVVDLFVLDSKMNVTVPLDRAVERGLRLVTTKAAAERSLEALVSGYEEAIPWNRDGRLLKDRFAEGELDAMVEVLASLVDTAETRKLNDGQRTLMEKVRKAYARELAAALKLDDEATDARIDAAIEKRIAAK
jgi:RNA polymerase-interacting CarD/CdnL/TRCF family regulator